MKAAVALARIERWIAASAPTTWHALNPPATIEDLDRAESEMGLRILPDAKRLYLWHDGGGGPDRALWLVPDFGLMSIDQMLHRWRLERDLAEGDPDAPRLRWVPICTAFTGDVVVVDHSPEGTGAVFPVLRGDGAVRWRGWDNLPTVLEQVVLSMEAGAPIRGRLPRVDHNGAFQWADDHAIYAKDLRHGSDT